MIFRTPEIHQYCSLLAFHSAHTDRDWPFAWTVLNRRAAFTEKPVCVLTKFLKVKLQNASLEEQVGCGWWWLHYKGVISHRSVCALIQYMRLSHWSSGCVCDISKYASRQHICVIFCAKWPSPSLAGCDAHLNPPVLMSNTSFKDKITLNLKKLQSTMKSKWITGHGHFWSALSL